MNLQQFINRDLTDYDLCKSILDLCRIYYREEKDNWGRPCMLVPENFVVTYDQEGKASEPDWSINFSVNGMYVYAKHPIANASWHHILGK